MCGLVGVTWIGQSTDIGPLIDAMRHRGPDDTGQFSADGLSLGHSRLSILDLSAAGHQPMLSNDDRYVLVFNGEIYNHLDIRRELASEHEFRSTSDTETLLCGLIKFGEQLLPRLNGIFSLAFYDRHTQRLLLARDHFGTKPLYYTVTQGRLAFASELKSLLELPNLCRELDLRGIVNYLSFLWSPGGHTPLESVHKLRPGHCAWVNLHHPIEALEEVRYYLPPFNGTRSSATELQLIDELDQRLQDAVERQLLSDVPVGFFLSGGLDSSLIVALARKLRPGVPLQAFTIDTTGVESTEGFVSDLVYARKAAQHLDVTLEVVDPTLDLLPLFDRIIWHLDEPQADAAPMNVLAICERAKEMGYKVLLGGTAADDLFSGYRRHEALALEPWLSWVPRWLRSWMTAAARQLPSRPALFRRLRKLSAGISKTPVDRMVGYFSWIDPDRVRALLSPQSRERLGGYDPLETLKAYLNEIPNEKSPLNQMLYVELQSFLVDHNLNYTDKLSMATGVEVRVPYLDIDLVEFSTTIPLDLKMRGRVTKYLLRKVAERYLPHDVIYRPKAGFGGPVRKWILDDLGPMIKERLSIDRIAQRGLFDPLAVRQLIEDNRTGKIDAAYTVWTLLAIESWCMQFADHSSNSDTKAATRTTAFSRCP